MNIVLAGIGAFGLKHLDAIQNIEGADILCLVDPDLTKAEKIAEVYSVKHTASNLTEALALPNIDAVILCTPTHLHAEQALQCMNAGKHVQVEIPVADSAQDALAVAKSQRETGLVCMVGHTRRYNPSHNGYTTLFNEGNVRFNKWTYRPTFFVDPT